MKLINFDAKKWRNVAERSPSRSTLFAEEHQLIIAGITGR